MPQRSCCTTRAASSCGLDARGSRMLLATRRASPTTPLAQVFGRVGLARCRPPTPAPISSLLSFHRIATLPPDCRVCHTAPLWFLSLTIVVTQRRLLAQCSCSLLLTRFLLLFNHGTRYSFCGAVHHSDGRHPPARGWPLRLGCLPHNLPPRLSLAPAGGRPCAHPPPAHAQRDGGHPPPRSL